MLQLLAQDQVAIAATTPDQYVESTVKTITSDLPSSTQDALEGIRTGLRDVVFQTALSVKRLSEVTVEQALEMGQHLWRMQRDLKRKEYKLFLSILGWATVKVRKYINLAKTFDGFQASQLIGVELTTLLGLCSSRYSSIVAQLRQVQDITQQMVEQLIKNNASALAPKQDPISGWKQCRSGGGRYYNVLLHDEETGILIEQQAQAEQILPQTVIASAIALMAQHKSSTVHSDENARKGKEEGIDVEQEASQEWENKKLKQELEKRDLLIAELEAQLARSLASHQAETESVVELASRELNEIEERQVAEIANGQITEDEAGTVAATWAKEPEQELTYLEPLTLDDAQNLKLEQNNGKLSDSVPRARHQSKLQPVEILTSAGSWDSGYFVHSCIAVANLVGQERRFTLFDANGDMCNFLGQIRPARSGGEGNKFS